MKAKIANALRTKYQRFGLSNEAVDRIASALEKTVTAESDIEGAIAEARTVELIANELQKSADAERRVRSDLQKSFDEYKEKHPHIDDPKEPPKGGIDDELKAMFLEMRKQNDELKRRLDEGDAKAKESAMREAVRMGLEGSSRNNKAIIEVLMDTFKFGDSDTAEALVERYKGAYDEKYKAFYGDGIMPPASGLFQHPVGGDDKDEFKGAVDRLRAKGVLPAQNK